MKIDSPNIVINKIKLILLPDTPDQNPPAGSVFLYMKDDENLYTLDSSGVETQMNGGGGGGGEPTMIPPILITPWSYETKQGTYERLVTYLYYNTSNTDGDYLEFDMFLAAGTYTFILTYSQGSNGAKLDITLDGVNVATGIDCYGSSADLRSVTTGVNVASGGFGKKVRVKVNGKNASSSAYYMFWSQLQIVQTA